MVKIKKLEKNTISLRVLSFWIVLDIETDKNGKRK